MGGQDTTAAQAAAAGPGLRSAHGFRSPGLAPRLAADRRPWWIWIAPFALVLTVLVVRSRFLFTASFYEQGDAGANSILIQQAMHGTLLIGNYSREGFNHPGPAYMYVQAAGQWLFLYALHLVPTAWNAHVLAVFALNSSFVAMITGVVYGWTRSLRGAAVCLAVVLGFVATQPSILSLDWMPWMYVPAYIAFLVAAGSVAAGASRDLWILTLSRLVPDPRARQFPVLRAGGPRRGAGRGGVAARNPREPEGFLPRAGLGSGGGHQRGLRPADRGQPGAALAGGLRQVFLVHLLLPGRAGTVSGRSCGTRCGSGGAVAARGPRRWCRWCPYAAAIAAVGWLSRGAVRRFLAALLAVNVVSTLAFACYAAVGIDSLSHYYIGYFYFSAPIITLLVIALAVVHAPPAPVGAVLAVGAAVLGVAAFAAAPATAVSTEDTDAALPHAVQAVAAQAHGKTIVIRFNHNAWIDVTGFLVQAERTGVRACVQDPAWTFMMSRQFICTPGQIAAGAPFWFSAPTAPSGTMVIATLKNSQIIVGSGP